MTANGFSSDPEDPFVVYQKCSGFVRHENIVAQEDFLEMKATDLPVMPKWEVEEGTVQ
jgi:hypothetical protein